MLVKKNLKNKLLILVALFAINGKCYAMNLRDIVDKLYIGRILGKEAEYLYENSDIAKELIENKLKESKTSRKGIVDCSKINPMIQGEERLSRFELKK